MAGEPTVYHVDDDNLFRRALELLVESVQVGYAGYSSAQAFLESPRSDNPSCLVTDVRMPGLSGMELLRHCSARGIHMPIIVCTGHAEVTLAVASMKAGAFDFFEKPVRNQALLESIQSALLLDGQCRQERARHQKTADRLLTLTPGEEAVLNRILLGMGYKEIAKELQVSSKTVEARRARLLEKMACETVAELLAVVLSYRLAPAREGGLR